MRSLLETPVLVADAQATGPKPSTGSLIELAWARATATDPDVQQAVAHLLRLPRGRALPAPVARVTGIDARDLAGGCDASAAFESMRRAGRTLSAPPIPLVIHYARYEEPFLRALHEESDAGEPFPFRVVCTHTIARHVLTDLPRRGLRALAGYFGWGLGKLRRAGHHVAATGFVWHHLVGMLGERGVQTWDDLRVFLAREPPRRSSRRVYPMPRERRLGLPDAPGVYHFLRDGGDVVYVGKATSLKRRVNGYFQKQRGVDERALEMLSQVRDVRVCITQTAIEAALLEADTIKALAPPYNVALVEDARTVSFFSRDLSDYRDRVDASHPIGPLLSARAVETLLPLRRALAGDTDLRLRDATLGVSEGRGPDVRIWAGGLEIVRATHGLGFDAPPSLRRLLAIGGALRRDPLDDAPDDSGDASTVDDGASERPRWDPERVVSVVESNLRATALALRRARWLCCLSESTVVFWGAGRDEPRRLQISRGRVTAADDVPTPSVPAGRRRAARQRREALDLAATDRMRVLTTELRRHLARGGAATIRLSAAAPLAGQRLGEALRWV